MKAAVLEQFKTPLNVREVADPEPGTGEVLVRTGAAGICRTDLKIIEGAIPTVRTPLVLGHELAGEVAVRGAGVGEFAEGDRVSVCLDISCGTCAYCLIGERDHCARLERLGIEQDGALAELVRVPASTLIPIPPSMSYQQAATIPDAVGSPYHAVVRRAEVRPGQMVAVYGLGGLGLTAVQVARVCGAQVIAIARTPERRRLAEALGATWSVDPGDGDVANQVRELTGGLGVHAFLDIVGIAGSVDQGVRACRKGGRVVVLGYFEPTLTATMMQLVYSEVAIMGSRSSTRADLLESIHLVEQGRIRPVVGHELSLEDVNDGLERLRTGSIIGRAVVRFD